MCLPGFGAIPITLSMSLDLEGFITVQPVLGFTNSAQSVKQSSMLSGSVNGVAFILCHKVVVGLMKMVH